MKAKKRCSSQQFELSTRRSISKPRMRSESHDVTRHAVMVLVSGAVPPVYPIEGEAIMTKPTSQAA